MKRRGETPQLDLFGAVVERVEIEVAAPTASPTSTAVTEQPAEQPPPIDVEITGHPVTRRDQLLSERPDGLVDVNFEVDLDDYQGDGWPKSAYATLGPPPKVAVMRALTAVAEATGWSGAWSKVLRAWWACLGRLGPDGEELEAEYLAIIRALPPSAVDAMVEGFRALVVHFHRNGAFCDVLGPVHMEASARGRRDLTGQFFTPWSLCLLSAEMAGIPDAPLRDDGEPWSVLDPAVGSASMLLAYRGLFAKRHGRVAASTLRLCGQDSDGDCVLMSRIQLRMTDVLTMHALLATAALPIEQARQAAKMAAVLNLICEI